MSADLDRELAAALAREDWDKAQTLGDELDTLTARATARLGNAALWYAEMGFPVFPVQGGTKTPYSRSRGLHDATTDPDQVREWWGRWPEANVGLATGVRMDVIDFDGAHSHSEWTRYYGPTWEDAEVTPLASVSTPRPGGLHIYVRVTGEGNHAGVVPGVDYRGRGGYVLAPPSRLDDRPGQHAGTYRFARPIDPKDL